MKNGNELEKQAKKPIVYKLELETYLVNVQEKADKISDKFVIMFFVLGACLAPVYDTWIFMSANSIIIGVLYLMARFVLTNKFVARMIISLVYAIFMLQFIGQMHGMAEMHFFFFINVALLIIYQDWRIMIPYTVFAIGHHSVLAILQANAANIDFLNGANLGNYFIGFQGRTIEGETVSYITVFQLFFHFGLAAMMAFICGWWAIVFRENSILLIEKQFEEQAKNEELVSSSEELHQNAEELQSTNDQLQIIQKEVGEKQKLLNRAEKLAYSGSYDLDLKSTKLTHSENLPFIYGEEQLPDLQTILDLVHQEDKNKVAELFRQAARGTISNYVIEYRSKGKYFEEYKYFRTIGEIIEDNRKRAIGTIQDITEEVLQKLEVEEAYRKIQASEEELKQNYEELQTTQELVNNAFSELDAQFNAIGTTLGYVEMNIDRKVERVNQLFADWLEYEVDELQGKPHLQFIPTTQEDKEKYEILWQTLEKGENVTDVFKRKTKDGQEVWLYGAYSPVKNKAGEIVKIIKVASNYSKQKESENQIKFSNARLQNLIENVGDLVFLLNTDFVFKEYYASSNENLFIEPEFFLEKKITEVAFPQKPLQCILEALQKAKQTKEKTMVEYQLDLPQGEEWFSLIVSPILNDQKEVEDILCVTRNITYIKKTEIAVQEQNIELAKQKEEVEKSLVELQNAQNQLIQSEKMASLGQLVANIAHEINTPLGAIRSSAVSIEEILNTTLSSLPSFSKKLDNHIIHGFNDFMELSIKKTDSLSSREKRAVKYDLIEEFEQLKIQNPEDYADWIVDMNMQDEKSLFSPLLKDKNAREIFQTAYQLSSVIRSNKTIKTATDRAAKIVFALKNYVRQEQTDEKIAVNINESIEITLTLYHNQIKHGVDVTRDLGDVPEFMGYPDELVQVWTNIIHNALQAMKNKGRLFIQTSVENNNVLVSIQDNGGGVPKEVQDRIFDAFFTTKAAGEGSGLGLDITKKIIEKHNGKIWFDSLDGKGTTFFIELPLTDK